MLDEHVARMTISHLISEDLLVNGPLEWLSDLVTKVCNSLHACISCVIGVNDTHEVVLGQRL